MPWPDIFFKSKKPKPAPEPIPVSPAPPTEAEKKRAVEIALEADEKADSLRALTESGSGPIAARGVKDSPLTAIAKAKVDEDRSNAETTRITVSSATAEFGATPSTLRSGSVSLRQRAKLTDDALVPQKSDGKPPQIEEKSAPADLAKKMGETGPSEVKPAPAAVVPAAFPVAVETGSVLNETSDKKSGPDAPSETKRDEAMRVDAETPAKSPSTTDPGKPDTADPASATDQRDTTRVRLGDTTPKPSAAIESIKPPSDSREKQEFVLANGERIFGHILSETPQTIYLDHGTLGVLTLPRSQIAKNPIEVILINGDRIVGDLIAETPDCLYVKHASLGMLTVPHNQRSTRVVEAIMKDGDRILGEVLAETDNFTVIRSATLGTVAVQHEQVAMLNRKIEQMQLRTLPPSAPALNDKPKT
jgi:RNase P/RNase MRP subunit p29